MKDLYFEKDYGRLYEKIENGCCEVFEFHYESGKVRHLFIKRKIPMPIDGQYYYDLVTPYGYGGPIITECEEEKKRELVNAFQLKFQKYCEENRIVSEFVRFHPLLSNAADFEECYELTLRRYTTGTNLKDYEDPVREEFSKSKQKSIKKALAAGVQFRITKNPTDLSAFKEIYYRTMTRKNAEAIYYFDDDYFTKLLNYLGEYILLVEVLYEEKVIGVGLNFVYGKTMHIHLSGTIEGYHHLSPAFVMRYALVRWGKENGIDLIHEGGGKTKNADDSLYLFKKQFGKNTDFKFFVSERVWNEEIYEKLCELSGVTGDTGVFPPYRKQILEETKLPSYVNT